MADKADINPKIFRWARESAKMSEETAASKVNITVEKLREWEEGSSQPTVRQAQNLAKAYKRPFALLFLSEIPSDFQPLRDFRRKGSKPLGTASTFIIREVQQKQAWISDLNREDGGTQAEFVGRFSLNDDPARIAADILSTLGIDPLAYTSTAPIREWIEKAESAGVFVSRTSFIHARLTLDSDEIQGFAIADAHAPFVFVNSDDWDSAQLFTLVHELAHLWIAATGISNEIESEILDPKGYDPIELFCNEIAGNALMPASFVSKLKAGATFDSAVSLYESARRLGVSSLALIVRALKLNVIAPARFRELKVEVDRAFNAFMRKEVEKKQKAKESKGGPNYYLLQVNRNGRLFTQIVLDAFRGGLIQPTQASGLLNVKVTSFRKLEEQLYR